VLRGITCPRASPAAGLRLRATAALLGHADAGHHHRRHEVGRVHAHRSRRGGAVYALVVACSSPRDELAEIYGVLARAAKTTPS
jgi:hypothetical protein